MPRNVFFNMQELDYLASFYGLFYGMSNEHWFYANADIEKIMHNREFCSFFKK